MEARSQLRHRPTVEDTIVLMLVTSFILADRAEIVNAVGLPRSDLFFEVMRDESAQDQRIKSL